MYIYTQTGYPMNISKQSLAAPGTPHTWPVILGLLIWLVEYLEYSIIANECIDLSSNSEAMFFEYCSQTYQKFLAGDDQQQMELEAELNQGFQEKNEFILKEKAAI